MHGYARLCIKNNPLNSLFHYLPPALLAGRFDPPPIPVAESSKTAPGSVRRAFGKPSGFVRELFGKTPHFFGVSSGVLRENPLFLRELFGKRSGNTPFSSGNVRLPPEARWEDSRTGPGTRREPAAGPAKAVCPHPAICPGAVCQDSRTDSAILEPPHPARNRQDGAFTGDKSLQKTGRACLFASF